MQHVQRLGVLALCFALLSACGINAPAEQLSQPTVVPSAIIGTPAQTAMTVPTATPASAATQIASNPTTLSTPGPGTTVALGLDRLNFGVVGHLYYTDRSTALAKTREAGFEWFRQQIHWKDIEDRSGAYFWADLDNIVNETHAAGIKLLISVVRSPSWYTSDGSDGKPEDAAALARFLAALTERYKGKVQAIEVWNEQNLAHENGGLASLEEAGQYVEILAQAYTAIKAVDPSVIVVAGAPSSTATNIATIAVPDIDYLRAMYSYKDGMIRDYFDVQALHPGGSANPPETLWPDNPSNADGWTTDPTFYFRHLENQRRVMEAAGLADRQVWVTEFGWATANNTPGFEFGNQISFEEQRDYIVGAIEWTYTNYPWVSNLFLWNLNFTVLQRESGRDPLHEQGSFSIVNSDWSPRPAFVGVQQVIARIRAEQGN